MELKSKEKKKARIKLIVKRFNVALENYKNIT